MCVRLCEHVYLHKNSLVSFVQIWRDALTTAVAPILPDHPISSSRATTIHPTGTRLSYRAALDSSLARTTTTMAISYQVTQGSAGEKKARLVRASWHRRTSSPYRRATSNRFQAWSGLLWRRCHEIRVEQLVASWARSSVSTCG